MGAAFPEKPLRLRMGSCHPNDLRNLPVDGASVRIQPGYPKRRRPAGPAVESRGAQIEIEGRPKMVLAHYRFYQPVA